MSTRTPLPPPPMPDKLAEEALREVWATALAAISKGHLYMNAPLSESYSAAGEMLGGLGLLAETLTRVHQRCGSALGVEKPPKAPDLPDLFNAKEKDGT